MATRDGEPEEKKSGRQPEVEVKRRILMAKKEKALVTSGNVCHDPSGQRRPSTRVQSPSGSVQGGLHGAWSRVVWSAVRSMANEQQGGFCIQ